ncbi:MAG: hypothetical protein AAB767_04175, partial [Patescibacteria group bacterium]
IFPSSDRKSVGVVVSKKKESVRFVSGLLGSRMRFNAIVGEYQRAFTDVCRRIQYHSTESRAGYGLSESGCFILIKNEDTWYD